MTEGEIIKDKANAERSAMKERAKVVALIMGKANDPFALDDDAELYRELAAEILRGDHHG